MHMKFIFLMVKGLIGNLYMGEFVYYGHNEMVSRLNLLTEKGEFFCYKRKN